MSDYKVSVLVGSLRKASTNRMLANALIANAPENLSFRIVEIGDLPFYNEDREDPAPDTWTRFRKEIGESDAVIFVSPEYNRTMPAAIKNALDVGSRPFGKSVWDGKPAAVITGSPSGIGGFGANHNIRQALVFLNMPVMQQPEAYISGMWDKFDSDGNLIKESDREFVQKIITAFADWIERVGPTA